MILPCLLSFSVAKVLFQVFILLVLIVILIFVLFLAIFANHSLEIIIFLLLFVPLALISVFLTNYFTEQFIVVCLLYFDIIFFFLLFITVVIVIILLALIVSLVSGRILQLVDKIEVFIIACGWIAFLTRVRSKRSVFDLVSLLDIILIVIMPFRDGL